MNKNPPTNAKGWRIKICPKCGGQDWFFGRKEVCGDCKSAERKAAGIEQKQSARRLTLKAISAGSLVRQPCTVCVDRRFEQIGASQAHHEDYSKPLDIVWLCTLHHKWRHQEIERGISAPESEYIKHLFNAERGVSQP